MRVQSWAQCHVDECFHVTAAVCRGRALRSALLCSVLWRPTNKPPVTAADPIRGPLCLSPRNFDHAQPQTVGPGLDQIAADASCDKARLTPSDTKATSHCAHFLRFFFFTASV